MDTTETEQKLTERTRKRYSRIAPIYDAMELFSERRYRSWRSVPTTTLT